MVFINLSGTLLVFLDYEEKATQTQPAHFLCCAVLWCLFLFPHSAGGADGDGSQRQTYCQLINANECAAATVATLRQCQAQLRIAPCLLHCIS